MSLELTYFGHSAFQIRSGKHVLLIDPFLNDNPLCNTMAQDVDPTAILLTHGHGDHVGDTLEIARRTNCLVIANFEISNWLQAQGVKHVHSMHLGGEHEFEFGKVKLTLAHHGSQLPDGSYGGNPAGLLLKLEDRVIYHAGDTALFLDMQLIADENLDLAILPIGDNYTMGPADSVRAIDFLRAPTVIPCHYNTWPVIAQDARKWAEMVRAETESEPVVLNSGDVWTLQ
ncbi:MAG: metal-dependent hydrolase [Planctomycetaceae bacterium]|nr:metal-dependent hydrolase [Planctomycetaceae bacterium]